MTTASPLRQVAMDSEALTRLEVAYDILLTASCVGHEAFTPVAQGQLSVVLDTLTDLIGSMKDLRDTEVGTEEEA